MICQSCPPFPFVSLSIPGPALAPSFAITFCIKYARRLHPTPKTKRENSGRPRVEARPPLLPASALRVPGKTATAPAGLAPARGKPSHRHAGGRARSPSALLAFSDLRFSALRGQGPEQAQAERKIATSPHPRLKKRKDGRKSSSRNLGGDSPPRPPGTKH